MCFDEYTKVYLILFLYFITSTIGHEVDIEEACDSVCKDLPANDVQPVCMMFSRYKKGYLYFANQCHARRSICRENLVLYMVHPSRCFKTRQYYMPIS